MLRRDDMVGRPELVPAFREVAGGVCADATFDVLGGDAAAVGDVFHEIDVNCVKVTSALAVLSCSMDAP